MPVPEVHTRISWGRVLRMEVVDVPETCLSGVRTKSMPYKANTLCQLARIFSILMNLVLDTASFPPHSNKPMITVSIAFTTLTSLHFPCLCSSLASYSRFLRWRCLEEQRQS